MRTSPYRACWAPVDWNAGNIQPLYVCSMCFSLRSTGINIKIHCFTSLCKHTSPGTWKKEILSSVVNLSMFARRTLRSMSTRCQNPAKKLENVVSFSRIYFACCWRRENYHSRSTILRKTTCTWIVPESTVSCFWAWSETLPVWLQHKWLKSKMQFFKWS